MKTLTIDADAYARLVDSHGRLVKAAKMAYGRMECSPTCGTTEDFGCTCGADDAHDAIQEALAAAKRIKDA